MANLTVDVLDPAGKKAGTAELPAAIFDVQTNVALIHQVVTAQRNAARQGTHKAKTRGEVAGGGRKPWKQKGTGRARQGSIRAPQWTGGGIVHGPTPRDYSQRTPKKMKAAALRGALSDRARCGRVHVVTALLEGDTPSTKAVVKTLSAISDRKHLLLVVRRGDTIGALSSRNLKDSHVLFADQLNTYDVMLSDDVVFTSGALEDFVAAAMLTASKSKAAASVSAQAAPAAESAEVAEAPFGEGSAAALADGSAPEGYTIKGNKDSMKYHTEQSPWYGRTKAEVWFASEEAAQAAGFVNAVRSAEEDAK
ncbi:50S ribosomal protein L4 [Helcobacillus massiliensis]|uniref:50S ribosomal protein L4, sunset domain variant n=1 Tax=Helcobacillus TaxID=1161125 RepID=UPI001EF65211|nr:MULTISPECIES: 50S ribosomal protein L4 [Helcobacillus]MCG7426202.1 50S ribosomal protein L4 [Helcobacillus sp. ACRRO]MCT1558542.1 50S ribosomal protein L4 [Helcobacillus massiliensis]MCT2037504.1 50S ribosomal protein L4 [Helcobacillus massiliensis]MCT2332366.1 50S ribosomal protein L4 [Helcobacillus massiliensis]MDK7742567.1 50S ribosomal protein L4 [Helcobacillus massiliensis]